MVAGVRFVISEEEDLASGSGTVLDHSDLLCGRIFIEVKKDSQKASDIDVRKGSESAPLASLIRAYIPSPDPLLQYASQDNRISQKFLVKEEKHVLQQDTLLVYNH